MCVAPVSEFVVRVRTDRSGGEAQGPATTAVGTEFGFFGTA
jgi:hypothetical protein